MPDAVAVYGVLCDKQEMYGLSLQQFIAVRAGGTLARSAPLSHTYQKYLVKKVLKGE